MKAVKFLSCLCLLPTFFLHAADGIHDLNTPRTFPSIESKAEWQARAKEIREHVLVSCGLWPMPEKTPLEAKIFDRVERDGYTVEKVYFQTYPNFYLAGNLYRPLQASGSGDERGRRYPGVLNPHGHWSNGRMADEEAGSVAARCISFARQGMVAFSYDMVGYNDTRQVPDHRAYATHPTNLLWSISLMGLQTWNSIRALDFLESLPDVDPRRLACTGESGGGTQTFMLGAIDSRLALQAPIVMVSHSMQGGCLCENAPGLRVDYSNMEIAAAAAPRPQILVAASGDWTKKTMSVEGPSIEKIYELFGAKDHFHYTLFDFGHNYNKTSREAVYRWFGKWLLQEEDPERLREKAYVKEPDADLRVFKDGNFPPGAVEEKEFLASLVRNAQTQIERFQPKDKKSLAQWKAQFQPAWEHDLQLQHVEAESVVTEETNDGEMTARIKRRPDGAEVNVTVLKPELKPEGQKSRGRALVIIGSVRDEDREGSQKLAETLRNGGMPTLLVWHEPAPGRINQLTNFFTTYNRTIVQNRTADLKVAVEYARNEFKDTPVFIIGRGSAGLAALAAAPLVSGVVADCAGLDDSKDENLLELAVFFPGARRIASFQGIAALAAPNPLLLHNTAGKLNVSWLGPLYKGSDKAYRHVDERASDQSIVDWLQKTNKE